MSLLASLNLCAFCSPSANFSTRRTTTLKRLARLPLIQDSHRYWERLLTEEGAESPGQFLQFNQTALALDSAANAQGIAIAPRQIAAKDVELGRLIEIWRVNRQSTSGFWLVQPKTTAPNTAAVRMLAKWLQRECGLTC